MRLRTWTVVPRSGAAVPVGAGARYSRILLAQSGRGEVLPLIVDDVEVVQGWRPVGQRHHLLGDLSRPHSRRGGCCCQSGWPSPRGCREVGLPPRPWLYLTLHRLQARRPPTSPLPGLPGLARRSAGRRCPLGSFLPPEPLHPLGQGNIVGDPRARHRPAPARSASSESRVRSPITPRSHSVTASKTLATSLPPGLDVSIYTSRATSTAMGPRTIRAGCRSPPLIATTGRAWPPPAHRRRPLR
jgi:hypothetical protein